MTCNKIEAWITSHCQNRTLFPPQTPGSGIVYFYFHGASKCQLTIFFFFLPQNLAESRRKNSKYLGLVKKKKAGKKKQEKGKWNLTYFVSYSLRRRNEYLSLSELELLFHFPLRSKALNT